MVLGGMLMHEPLPKLNVTSNQPDGASNEGRDMLADQIYEFRNMLRNQGIIFCYSGYVTEKVLSGIGEALKQKLQLEDADTKTVRNVFAIFVEQMQNIIRYSAEKEPADGEQPNNEIRYGVLAIGSEADKFFITCGNKIMRADVDRLDKRLREIQQMDKDELKQVYKNILRAPTEATSKGAGVGFVEIARRSSEVIDFGFKEIDDEYSFFCLKAYI